MAHHNKKDANAHMSIASAQAKACWSTSSLLLSCTGHAHRAEAC